MENIFKHHQEALEAEIKRNTELLAENVKLKRFLESYDRHNKRLCNELAKYRYEGYEDPFDAEREAYQAYCEMRGK